MKKFCISFLVCIIIILSVVGLTLPNEQVNQEYLRIHIRADSNDSDAQMIKYQVKDNIVEYLTPIISTLTTKKMAQERLKKELPNIIKIANQVLEEGGFCYKAKASIKSQRFPTRVYDGLTLNEGFYDALIVELGSGKGDNWWCVVYPPLCFVNQNTPYIYKSKI